MGYTKISTESDDKEQLIAYRDSLVHEVIKYFSSSNQEYFFEDPRIVFEKMVTQANFQNFHQCIQYIQSNENKHATNLSTNKLKVESGHRYVVAFDPNQRGSVAKVDSKIVDGIPKQLVSLRMDKSALPWWRIVFWYLYLRSLINVYDANDLQLEHQYYQSLVLENCELEIEQKPIRNGNARGIEGRSNSCYMDALLFTMFFRTSSFDTLLQAKPLDDEIAKDTRHILQKDIIEPLRSEEFCSADNVMKLRRCLQHVNQDILGSFMDVEEFLYLICEDVLKETPFIKYDGGGEDFVHFLQIDLLDGSKVISVQNNLELSMKINGDMKFAQVPSPALILALPRSNGSLVHYDAVVPSLKLDIRNFLEPADCESCKKPATWEVYNEAKINTACSACVNTFSSEDVIVGRESMRLQSVICIRASHFVSFVRDGESDQWLFFDSMAGGHPEVTNINNFEQMVNSVEKQSIAYDNPELLPLVQRVFTDGHICIYEPEYLKRN